MLKIDLGVEPQGVCKFVFGASFILEILYLGQIIDFVFGANMNISNKKVSRKLCINIVIG